MFGLIKGLVGGIRKGVQAIKKRRRAKRARRDRMNFALTIRSMSPAAQQAIIRKLERSGKLTPDMMVALHKAGVGLTPQSLLHAC